MELSIHSLIFDLGSAPTLVAATWPWEKIIMVGMPRTPYLVGTCGFSSILILAIVTLSPSSADNSSSAGAIMRQGPHHSAQKSTKTGFLASRTSAWKEASDTLMGMGLSSFRAHYLAVAWPDGKPASTFPGHAPYLGMPLLRVKPPSDQGHLAVQDGVGEPHQARAVGPDQAADDSLIREYPAGRGAV